MYKTVGLAALLVATIAITSTSKSGATPVPFPSPLIVPGAFTQTEETLHTFTGGSDGGDPLSSLVMDAAGNLYGTTFVAGQFGAGEVFELTPQAGGGWEESVLYSFTGGADGANPYYADVIFDKSGNLYGTTVGGGTFNSGTVFELTPATGGGWTESVLYNFSGGFADGFDSVLDGANPYAGLVFDSAGNLYGTTFGGGDSGVGTVFELTRDSGGQWAETVIHAFNGTNGASPAGGLVFDQKGNLYGVALGGGIKGAGVVFALTPSTNGHWAERILHGFTGGIDGSSPYAERLIFDRAGNLYGTTQAGGTFQKGLVFSLTPTSNGIWKERVLYNFDGGVAANPYAGLVSDANGNLYGTCASGNGVTTVGAVFKLSPRSNGKWAESMLHLFNRTDGEFPEASLLRDAAGNLYGTTLLGGTDNTGVVFEIKP